MPAAVAAAIDDACGERRSRPGDADRASTIRSRAARTSTTSRSSRPCFVDGDARRLGREPRPPRRRRRDGAGLDAARRDRDLPGGTAHPAACARRRRSRRSSSRRRARPTSGAATSTRSAAPTGSASRGCASSSTRSAPDVLDEIVDYGERRMRAALRGAARRRVARSTTCSTPPGPRPSSSRRRASW